ncbi:response regulator [Ascidiaceihabitans sp.]|uniref:response regulator n=1 Tax=Ascidiaceihabitans sp. TaxID=1872644 RepID=UPI0032968EB4
MLSSSYIETENDVFFGLANSASVLIIDDSEFDRKRIRRLFRDAGLNVFLDEVDTISNLQEMLNETSYDIVIIDYNLSEGTGIDAVTLLHSHPEHADTKAIMITGDDQSNVAVQAMKMGCEDYISKAQMTAERLKQAVVTSIRKRAAAQNSSAKMELMVQDLAKDVLSDLSGILQPKLANMLRDLRALKRQLSQPDTNIPERLENIDRNCIEMWNALAKAPNLCAELKTDKKLH